MKVSAAEVSAACEEAKFGIGAAFTVGRAGPVSTRSNRPQGGFAVVFHALRVGLTRPLQGFPCAVTAGLPCTSGQQ